MTDSRPVFEPLHPAVLIVAAAADERRRLRELLEAEPGVYLVTEAADAHAAWESFERAEPACVVLGCTLAGAERAEVMRGFAVGHRAHRCGVVAVIDNAEDAGGGEDPGAHDRVEAGELSAARLHRSVQNAVEKAATQRELRAGREHLARTSHELAACMSELEHEMAGRRRAELTTRAVVEQMHSVASHLPVAIAHIDRDFRYRFANAAFASRLGKEPEELLGKTVVEVVGAEDFQRHREKMEAALAGERVQFEATEDTGQGERWSNVACVPERDSEGRVAGLVWVSADVTERRQAEAAVAQARDQVAAATQARDNFLAALSHELRTPLNPVLLMASEAAENTDLPAAVRAEFAAIRNHVELEARLIDDLLDLARISHGKITLHRHRLGVAGIIRQALAIVKTEIDRKHLQLRMAAELPEATVMGDEVRLQQVFWNILKNAVKFTPAGGWVEIHAEIAPGANTVRVRIADSGIGLSAEELPAIFEAFSQGEHALGGYAHRFGGLGLGLAITRTLVEAHGGRITAESAGRDQGATFIVELPCERAEPAAESAPPARDMVARPAAGVAAPPQRKENILLVEDHASTRASLTLLLERRGFTVTAAASAEEAKAAAQGGDFSLVISDIGLPDGDGYECMHALQQIRPGVPGIALSGYGMEKDRLRSREAGFVEHLIKPVNMQMLDRAIAGARGARDAASLAKN